VLCLETRLFKGFSGIFDNKIQAPQEGCFALRSLLPLPEKRGCLTKVKWGSPKIL